MSVAPRRRDAGRGCSLTSSGAPWRLRDLVAGAVPRLSGDAAQPDGASTLTDAAAVVGDEDPVVADGELDRGVAERDRDPAVAGGRGCRVEAGHRARSSPRSPRSSPRPSPSRAASLNGVNPTARSGGRPRTPGRRRRPGPSPASVTHRSSPSGSRSIGSSKPVDELDVAARQVDLADAVDVVERHPHLVVRGDDAVRHLGHRRPASRRSVSGCRSARAGRGRATRRRACTVTHSVVAERRRR